MHVKSSPKDSTSTRNNQDSNPGPSDPEARCLPLDHIATLNACSIHYQAIINIPFSTIILKLWWFFCRLKSRHIIVQDEPWGEVLKFCKSKFEISFSPGSIWADVTAPRLPCLERMMLIKRSGNFFSLSPIWYIGAF